MALAYPHPSSPAVTAVMKGNRRRDTSPELRLRRRLHALGWRYRLDLRLTAGGRRPRPDVVFTRRRVAVFVDGCFWHGCPEHGRVPGGRNAAYWEAKLSRNRARDELDTAALAEAGWRVVRLWEHASLDEAVAAVEAALANGR